MYQFATVLAHLLVIILVIAVPIRGAQRYKILMRRIKRHPELRMRFYLSGIATQWIMLIPLAFIAWGLGWTPGSLGLQFPDRFWWGLLASGILLAIVYAQVFYIRHASGSSEGREMLRKAMQGPLDMLPRTAQERSLWIFLSLTAGICEEILYRGFLPLYIVEYFPIVAFWAALSLSAILFGIGHLYQKVPGVLGTAAIGLIFGALYFLTGSLLFPMIVHALFDARLLLIDINAIIDEPTTSVPGEDVPKAASL
jgi:membrane protease YdiL (CAAX protease family)